MKEINEDAAVLTAARNRGRALAQSRASGRLAKKYPKEYEQLYREECAALGLNTRSQTKAQRIQRLRDEIKRLEEKYGEAAE